MFLLTRDQQRCTQKEGAAEHRLIQFLDCPAQSWGPVSAADGTEAGEIHAGCWWLYLPQDQRPEEGRMLGESKVQGLRIHA
jgi:hypothetical protein